MLGFMFMRHLPKYYFSLFLLSLLSLSCDNPTPAEEPALELWPMKVGNFWELKTFHYDSTGTVEYSSPNTLRYETLAETSVAYQKMFLLLWESDAAGYATNKSDGFHMVIANAETTTAQTQLFYKYPAKRGDSIVATGVWNFRKYVVAIDTLLTIPLGTFKSYIYAPPNSDRYKYFIVFAPGVGLIKEEQYEKTNNGIWYLSYKKELVQYRVQ